MNINFENIKKRHLYSYVYLRELLETINEDYNKVYIQLSLNTENIKDATIKELIENKEAGNRILHIQKAGFSIFLEVFFNDLNKQVITYTLCKIDTAVNESGFITLHDDETLILNINKNEKMDSLIEKAFSLLNNEINKETYKHPDELTSSVLYALALPQNYVPEYIRFDIEDERYKDFICIKRDTPKWYDTNTFRLNILMSNYKITLYNAEYLKGKKSQYASLLDYSEIENIKFENEDDYTHNSSENDIINEGIFTMNVFEIINSENYRYNDEDTEMSAAELDSISENIELAVIVLNNIKNMEYECKLY